MPNPTETFRAVTAYVRRLLTRPLGELNRWQRAVRYAVGVVRYGYQKFFEDQASQMAAALTYHTIFSLVPLLVMSLLVFKAFGGFQSVGGNLQGTIYDYLGLNAIEIQETRQAIQEGKPMEQVAPEQADPQVTPLGVEPGPADPGALVGGKDDDPQTPDEQQTKARVDQLLADLQDRVATVDFSSIRFVGLGLLIWASISLVISLETSFNRIYHAPKGRPLHLRVTIYWAVITLGPVLVALSFYLTAQLWNLATSVDAFGVMGWIVSVLTPLASTAATWLLLLLMYSLLPNVKVRLKSALIGSMIAAALWEASKWGFGLYLENFIREGTGYSALYGSIALLPLFLMWVYLTWLIILFGLEISYVSQTIRGTRFLKTHHEPEPTPVSGLTPPESIITIAAALADAFAQGKALHLSAIVRATSLPERSAEKLLAALVNAGYAHQLEGDDDGAGPYTLSRPAETIALRDVLQAGRQAVGGDPDPRSHDLLDRLYRAQAQAVGDTTLQDLLQQPDPTSPHTVAEPNPSLTVHPAPA